ncbi:hypothetical protein E3N88_19758 [Mikania micrantha]|uniref:J domain-containing protein n=1 Tax=Mikania micrantha TaxID=192012 RepID=A0A5N6NP38_9ASTR|nr:hypothetical protein E3N88_19758 [Mikania micrantha]
MGMELNQGSPSYYGILGVSIDSSDEQIRRAYRNLAMQWHPDKWMKNPSLLGKAKSKFQQIQEAYSVLSDQRKRSMYDVGLYHHQDEDDEGRNYSLGEIQNMFWDMAQSFNQSASSCFDDNGFWSKEIFTLNDDSRSSKRARVNTNLFSSIGMQETKCV